MKNDDEKPNKPKLSLVKSRLIKAHTAISLEPPKEIAYQHTVLCQTVLPYRNPGDQIREWQRDQGNVSLLIEAGRAKDPILETWTKLGLPFGTKARLILCYLNTEAIKLKSPVIELEKSLTAFVRSLLRRSPNGQEIREFKDQIPRISTALIRLAVTQEDRVLQVDTKVVTAFELLVKEEDTQRILWPSELRLSEEYFNSLMNHAVPIDVRAIAGLSHSAMALDVYCWLAQRLHRVPKGKPQFIAWSAVKEQFGQGIARMNNFKAQFRVAMRQVLTQYPCARVEGDDRGLILRHSLPPVPEVRFILPKPGK